MIPFLLLGAAVIAGGVGLAAGVEAVDNYRKANRIVSESKKKLNRTKNRLYYRRRKLREAVEDLGYVCISAVEVLESFSDYMNSLGSTVRNLPKKDIRGLEKLVKSISQYRNSLKQLSLGEDLAKATGVAAVGGVLSGAGAYAGAVALGTAIGTASTGTAISSLSGAAFSNALLAWFGGGAVAAGGGGMALGSLVLGGIAVGPAIGIAGIMLAQKSEEALTKAKEFERDVEEAVWSIELEIEELETMTQKIKERIREVKFHTGVLKDKLNELKSKESHTKKEVLTLIGTAKTLKNILDTPVLNFKEGLG